MSREVITLEGQPSNPMVSPVIRYGGLVFTAGMVGRDPETGELVPGGIEEQTRQTLDNIQRALEAAGTSMSMVIKATCFLANIDDRVAFNTVYREYFPTAAPVRTCVQAGRLGEGVLVEVEVIAGMPS